MQKMTINTSELQEGDFVIGWDREIEEIVTVIPGMFKVIFTDGFVWRTSDNFDTTIFRFDDES